MTRDLSGRTFLVTGANTGIGRATTTALAARGGRVILACRGEAAARAVMAAISEQHPGADLDFVPLDLGSLASVRACVEALARRTEPLHVLIANAGVAGQRGVTQDGFELHFGINHLGHFALITGLLAKLAASAPARVVVVASGSHYGAKVLDFAQLQRSTPSYFGYREYEVSKLCNVLFTAELARRAPPGVTSYSLHPGVIASDIWRRVPRPVRWLLTRGMKTVEQGAQSTLFCATDPAVAGQSGRFYWEDCQEKRPSRLAQQEDLQRELWERSAAWVGA